MSSTKKPGAVAATPATAASSSQNTSSSNSNNVADDDNLNITLRERRELQKRKKASAAGAGASNAVVASGGAGPAFKDQVREAPPQAPPVGIRSGTNTARQKYEMMRASDPREEEAKEMERSDDDDAETGAAVAGATIGAVAGTAKQRDNSPNFKDQVNEVPQGRSGDVEIGAAAAAGMATVGAVAGSARQQDGGPNFKDQVHEVPQSGSGPAATGTDEEEANSPGFYPVEGPDHTDVFESSDEYSEEDHVVRSGRNNLIEAELVKSARCAIPVALELEQEPPRKPFKTILIIVVASLLVIGGVIGGVLGSSDPGDKVVVVTSAPTVAPTAAPSNDSCAEAILLLESGSICLNYGWSFTGFSKLLQLFQSRHLQHRTLVPVFW